MAGSGWEALPEGREWSEGFPGGLGVVGNSQEAFPEKREWSGVLPGGPGVVRRPFRRAVSGR